MKKAVLIVLFFTSLSLSAQFAAPAAKFVCEARFSRITEKLLVGTWTEYRIQDNAQYLAIPDSLKSHSTIAFPVSDFIENIYQVYADSTYDFFAGLMDVEIGWSGTWRARNDTLILYEEGKPEPAYLPLRYISQGKIEVAEEARDTTYYRFFEKWPQWR